MSTNESQPRDDGQQTDEGHVRAFVARHCGVAPDDVTLTIKPLRGGLESVTVSRVQARMPHGQDAWRDLAFVVKHLHGEPSREAAIYHHLVQPMAGFVAPALLDIECLDPQSCLLFLEWVRPVQVWPWRHIRHIREVIEQLARLHTLPTAGATRVLAGWDYEKELLATAGGGLAFFDDARHLDVLASARRSLPALRRVVDALPAMRQHLLAFPSLGTAVLHGDVHSGNVLIGRAGNGHARGAVRPLLIDWGRARIGSPLEDVSSWLQSLGYWEPAARQRHDTLLAGYLQARGLPSQLGRELRDAYWLASASNILAGALQYYLGMAVDTGARVSTGSASVRARASARARADRAAAVSALEHALRIVRRADVCWRAHQARRGARARPAPAPAPGASARARSRGRDAARVC